MSSSPSPRPPGPTQKQLELSRAVKVGGGGAGGGGGAKVDGMTLEQQRRRLGNDVSLQISMRKYAIAANTHCTVDMGAATFKQLVVANANSVVPSDWNADTPVVVALMSGSGKIGEAFGKTKITGGNRYENYSASKMEVVYFPAQNRARLWWIMG